MNQLVRIVSVCLLGVTLVSVGGCSDDGDKAPRDPSTPPVASGNNLPFTLTFDADGSVDIKVLDDSTSGARIVDVKESEFPVKGNIKRVETVTLVTYEGSCEVLVKTKTGYKKIILNDPALCQNVLP